MSTKEKILEESLILFSENGYDGTSVEKIAARVGIKAPSLYKHYKGKEDILNALIDMIETRYEESFGSVDRIGELPESREDFVEKTMERIRFTMNDPMIKRMRKFVIQEQFRNERTGEIASKHQLDGIQRMYRRILGELMDEGRVVKDDPELMAMELTAPVVLYLAEVDRWPQKEKEGMEQIQAHLNHFCETYWIS